MNDNIDKSTIDTDNADMPTSRDELGVLFALWLVIDAKIRFARMQEEQKEKNEQKEKIKREINDAMADQIEKNADFQISVSEAYASSAAAQRMAKKMNDAFAVKTGTQMAHDAHDASAHAAGVAANISDQAAVNLSNLGTLNECSRKMSQGFGI